MTKFKAHWDELLPARDEASRVLPELLRHYFEMGDQVAVEDTSDELLHDFRLATKRARYTLELFEPFYGAGLKPHLEGLRKVQQVLGQLNDCIASLRFIGELDATADDAWIAAIHQRRHQKRAEFRRLWLDEFAGTARREDWIAVLERR